MKLEIVASIITVILQLFLISVYYLHTNHVFTPLAKWIIDFREGRVIEQPSAAEQVQSQSQPKPLQNKKITKEEAIPLPTTTEKVAPVISTTTTTTTPITQTTKAKTNNDPFQDWGGGLLHGNHHVSPKLCSKFLHCERLSFEENTKNLSFIIREYKEHYFPTAFSLLDRNYTWKAFDWNLWDFTQVRWPLLDHVLEVERTYSASEEVDTLDKIGLYLISEQNNDPNEPWWLRQGEEAAAISDAGTTATFTSSVFVPELPFPEEFHPYSIRSDMFLWDFLHELLPNRTILLNPQTNQPRFPPNICRYYSTNYRVFETFTQTETDTQWQILQIIDSLSSTNYPNKKEMIRKIAPLLNLLYPHCALQFRYNEYHLTKLQLQGKADYLFIPNQYHRYVFPFPYNYPFRRQSQVNFFDVASTAKTTTTTTAASSSSNNVATDSTLKKEVIQATLRNISNVYYVTLEKGQAVIVPPGYFVYSEARTLSMSLDILSPSKEQTRFYEILSIPIPCQLERKVIYEENNRMKVNEHYGPYLTLNESILCTQVYLVHILSRLQGIQNIEAYANNFYYSRYELLYSKQSLFMNSRQATQFQCFRNFPDFTDVVISNFNKKLIEKTAELVTKKLNSPKLSTSLRWLWIGNYIDSVVRKIYGGESYGQVALFMKECLNIKGKLEIVEEVEGPKVMKIGN